jgi:predicted ABC-type ATPase
LQRAQGGGHGASEREVRAIHEASLANLSAAVGAFERVDVYDSTERWSAPQLVAMSYDGRVDRLGPSPNWLEQALSVRDF